MNKQSKSTNGKAIMSLERLNNVPQCTLEYYEKEFGDRHLLHGVLSHWSRLKPDGVAIINVDTKEEITWAVFDQATTTLAQKLIKMGFKKGDFFATSLPFLTEHIYLEYACFKIGVIFAPLDLRLKAPEVIRSLTLIKAKGYAFLGKTEVADFRELGKVVMRECPFVDYFIQFSPPAETITGAISAVTLNGKSQAPATEKQDPVNYNKLSNYMEATAGVDANDGAMVIFTTGSTGYPKPALLSHRNITCQNMCLGTASITDENTRILVNAPPSHVGGQTEELMTALFFGQTAVVLPVYDPRKSLQAIQDYKVNILGQIPAMFSMEWILPDYDDYDLSSLKIATCAGQQVSRKHMEKVATMAPRIPTGLGLTEAAGFCTYTPIDAGVDEIMQGIGFSMPIYPVSIHKPMKEDGNAGDELPDGTLGNICFKGPQTFLGYVDAPEATAKTISKDAFLYTGDMGFKDEKGLHFAGRGKWIIKPKGYQVFPVQVEDHFTEIQEIVESCAVVGIEHNIFTEAIVAFIEKKPGVDLTIELLQSHAREIAAYMRPLHYVLLEPGKMPLNRVNKTDYVTLHEMAQKEVENLRNAGRWDR